eukprot:750173-Hanusia_phi.AAC.3
MAEEDDYNDIDGGWDLHESAPTPRSETEEEAQEAISFLKRSVSDSRSTIDSISRTPRSLSRFRPGGSYADKAGRWTAPKIDPTSVPTSTHEGSFGRTQTSPSFISRLSSSPFRAGFLRRRIPAKPSHPPALESSEHQEEDQIPDSVVSEAQIVINAAENFLHSIPASIEMFKKVLFDLDSLIGNGEERENQDVLMEKQQTLKDRIHNCEAAELEIREVRAWIGDQISNRTIVPNLLRANIQRLSNLIEIAQKNLTSPADEILVVTVQEADFLETTEEISRPCVLISVVDLRTGQFLKKSRTMRFLGRLCLCYSDVPCSTVIQRYERKAVLDVKRAKGSKKLQIQYRPAAEGYAYILPCLTQPCEACKESVVPSSSLHSISAKYRPVWNEEVLYDEEVWILMVDLERWRDFVMLPCELALFLRTSSLRVTHSLFLLNCPVIPPERCPGFCMEFDLGEQVSHLLQDDVMFFFEIVDLRDDPRCSLPSPCPWRRIAWAFCRPGELMAELEKSTGRREGQRKTRWTTKSVGDQLELQLYRYTWPAWWRAWRGLKGSSSPSQADLNKECVAFQSWRRGGKSKTRASWKSYPSKLTVGLQKMVRPVLEKIPKVVPAGVAVKEVTLRNFYELAGVSLQMSAREALWKGDTIEISFPGARWVGVCSKMSSDPAGVLRGLKSGGDEALKARWWETLYVADGGSPSSSCFDPWGGNQCLTSD